MSSVSQAGRMARLYRPVGQPELGLVSERGWRAFNHETHVVGSDEHVEYWIRADELDAFNASIIGPIEVIAEYRQPSDPDVLGKRTEA